MLRMLRIKGKINELTAFLEELGVDMLSFRIYRTDRLNGRGGGTAVAVTCHIIHS